MAKYLVQASYSKEGVKGVLNEGGSKRREAMEKAVKALGGTVEAVYFAFGDVDAFIIYTPIYLNHMPPDTLLPVCM
jgi:uncharacterized protein with GYD domain